MKNQRGYSIIEVITALTLLSILGLNFYSPKNQSQLKSKASLLRNKIAYNSLLAQFSGTEKNIEFTDKLTGGVEFSHIKFGQLGPNKKILTLRANGNATPGSIILTDGETTCIIKQALRGAISLKC